MKRVLRVSMVILGLTAGGWMAYDGGRALVIGDYVTPRSGPHAGQLGPWAAVVEAAGIHPRSPLMKSVFVSLGLTWIVASAAFAARRSWGGSLLLWVAVASLWYLPIGTMIALAEVAGLMLTGDRGWKRRSGDQRR